MTEMRIDIDVISRKSFADKIMHSADLFRNGEHVCNIRTWHITRKPDETAKLDAEWLTEWFRKIAKTIIPESKNKKEDIYFMRLCGASIGSLDFINNGEIPYYLDPSIIKISNGKTFFAASDLIAKYGGNYETTP